VHDRAAIPGMLQITEPRVFARLGFARTKGNLK
jgi:hypothetical protein